MLSFRHSATLAAVVALTLTPLLLSVPGLLWTLFGIDPVPEGDFAFRRAGGLFAIIGLTALALRRAPPSQLRRDLAGAFVLGMGLIAVLGLGEFARGFAGPAS